MWVPSQIHKAFKITNVPLQIAQQHQDVQGHSRTSKSKTRVKYVGKSKLIHLDNQLKTAKRLSNVRK
jgi:hypothetical protein